MTVHQQAHATKLRSMPHPHLLPLLLDRLQRGRQLGGLSTCCRLGPAPPALALQPQPLILRMQPMHLGKAMQTLISSCLVTPGTPHVGT